MVCSGEGVPDGARRILFVEFGDFFVVLNRANGSLFVSSRCNQLRCGEEGISSSNDLRRDKSGDSFFIHYLTTAGRSRVIPYVADLLVEYNYFVKFLSLFYCRTNFVKFGLALDR